LLDQLLAGAEPKSAFDPNGLFGQPAVGAGRTGSECEMGRYLSVEDKTGNGQNGYDKKMRPTELGSLKLNAQRDYCFSIQRRIRPRRQ
jgi:putative transposase